MNEIIKLINVLKLQEKRGYKKIEIVVGTSNAFIEIRPIIEALENQIPRPSEEYTTIADKNCANCSHSSDFECNTKFECEIDGSIHYSEDTCENFIE